MNLELSNISNKAVFTFYFSLGDRNYFIISLFVIFIVETKKKKKYKGLSFFYVTTNEFKLSF